MSKQTLEQKRAKHAWDKAAHYTKEHSNFAKGMPALIMNSGLMQVMAFCHEKGSKESQKHTEQVAQHLRDWLHEQCKTPKEFDKFMQHLMEADPRHFQDVTTEAFAWLKWLRQMAAARHGGE